MENSNSNDECERSTICLSMLPEDCTAKILGSTSPLDVCRLSLVCKSVQSAAVSDSVWEKFLPSDYQSIIAASLTPIPDFVSKKDLYVYLCHHPILIDAGRKSFSVEKWTGKKCYFLGARDLNITWGDAPQYWKWTSRPDSRFAEVAKLKHVWWLEIWGTIRAGVLSPRTSYVAYLVYKLEYEFGFHYRPSEVSVGVFGVELDKRFAFLVPEGRPQRQHNHYEESVYTLPSDAEDESEQLDDDYEESVYTLPSDTEDDPGLSDGDYEEEVYILPSYGEEDPGLREDSYWQSQHMPEDASSLVQSNIQRPKLRDDGWFEVELGEFYAENEDDCIEMRLKEVKDCLSHKEGLIVEGIVIRPRVG